MMQGRGRKRTCRGGGEKELGDWSAVLSLLLAMYLYRLLMMMYTSNGYGNWWEPVPMLILTAGQ